MEIHDGPDLDTTAITVTVTDNGPGIPDAVVERVLDFGNLSRTRRPTAARREAQQGNALKTVIGVATVLGGRPVVI